MDQNIPPVWRGLPQGGSVCDGEQGDAGIFGSLENLSFHVNAHSAGALIQQGVFRPDRGRGNGFKLVLCIHSMQSDWLCYTPINKIQLLQQMNYSFKGATSRVA